MLPAHPGSSCQQKPCATPQLLAQGELLCGCSGHRGGSEVVLVWLPQKSWGLSPRATDQLKLEHLLAVSAVFVGIFQPGFLPLRAASVPCPLVLLPQHPDGIQLAKSNQTHIGEETEVKGCLKSWALELCPPICRAQSRRMMITLHPPPPSQRASAELEQPAPFLGLWNLKR